MTEYLKKYLGQWIEKAEEDIVVINQLRSMDFPPKGAIGFHCQQAAEKFLKAFLLYHCKDIPKTHNIEYLLEQCKRIDPDFGSIASGNLTDYGVEIRYPGDFLEPSLSEIDFFLQAVLTIKNLTLNKIH